MIISLLMVTDYIGNGFILGEMESNASESSNTGAGIPVKNGPNRNNDINKAILRDKRSSVDIKRQLDQTNQQLENALKVDALKVDTAKIFETEYLKKNMDRLTRPLPLQPYDPRLLPTPGGVFIYTPYYPHFY
jgi:hypothetical protein